MLITVSLKNDFVVWFSSKVICFYNLNKLFSFREYSYLEQIMLMGFLIQFVCKIKSKRASYLLHAFHLFINLLEIRSTLRLFTISGSYWKSQFKTPRMLD